MSRGPKPNPDRASLDKLIDFYEANPNPKREKKITMNLDPEKVAFLVGYIFPFTAERKQKITRNIPYRGYTIHAAG